MITRLAATLAVAYLAFWGARTGLRTCRTDAARGVATLTATGFAVLALGAIWI